MATAVIRLHDAEAKGLRRIANAGVRFGAIGSEVLPMEPRDGLAIDAFHHGHPVQASDLNQVQSPLGREAAKVGLTAAVSYPLHNSEDQSIGTFTVFTSDEKAFDGETAGCCRKSPPPFHLPGLNIRPIPRSWPAGTTWNWPRKPGALAVPFSTCEKTPTPVHQSPAKSSV